MTRFDRVKEILDAYWASAVILPWRESDVFMLDNMLTAHARNPFVGSRKIVVAMAQMAESKSFAAT